MTKSRWLLLCVPWLVFSCTLFEPSIKVDVESVNLDWDNTIWTDIGFTVKNDSNVELSSIDIHFTKHCAGETFTDIAEFPNSNFDTSSPVAVGGTCIAGTELSTTTGGCISIEVTQIVVYYGLNKTETLIPEGVVFDKPQDAQSNSA